MKPDPYPGLKAGRLSPDERDQPLVATRRAAFERLSDVLENEPTGPILITGEPGAGKSWLADRLIESATPARAAIKVGLTSAIGPTEFLVSIAASLGLFPAEPTALVRSRIGQALLNDAADGRSPILVIDQPQRAAPATWEEIDIFVDSLGRPGGFAGMVVTANTEFIGMLAARRLRPFADSIAVHAHLLPLDLDEARELVATYLELDPPLEASLENLHRDSRGNPRRLLRLAKARRSIRGTSSSGLFTESTRASLNRLADPHSATPRDLEAESFRLLPTRERVSEVVDQHADSRWNRFDSDSEALDNNAILNGHHGYASPGDPTRAVDGLAEPEAANGKLESPSVAVSSSHSLIPAKPPLRVEDGLVEVGWDGDLEDEINDGPTATLENVAIIAEEPLETQLNADEQTAAIRAWLDWSRDREARPEFEQWPDVSNSDDGLEPHFNGLSHPDDELDALIDSGVTARSANIRAESPSEFAPYSHLFSRLRQSNQQ